MTSRTTTSSDTPVADPASRHQHPKARELVHRGLHLVRTGTNERADAVYQQPTELYLDPERFQEEVEVLFRRRPIFAGLSVELPRAGSFKTLEVPGFPLVIARQQDGSLRAFLNSCLHRGSNVAYGCGSTRAFVCKYHSWVYDLDGSLMKVRAPENFGELDDSCTALPQVAVAEDHGLIFVRATPLEDDPTQIDVDDVLCGMGEQFELQQLQTLEQVESATVQTASNWKLSVDTYLEPYHFASLHRTTVAKYNNSDQATFETYGPHTLNGFLGRRIHELEDVPEEEWPSLFKHVQMIYMLFPSTILSVMQDHVEYSQILPGPRPNQNIMHHIYFSYPDFEAVDIHKKRFDNTQWILTAEDIPMAEEMQSNIENGALKTFQFGRNEPGLQHQHRSIDEILAAHQDG